ncbi:MAG: acyl carrier protein, partial [Pseudomonadota bacterium]
PPGAAPLRSALPLCASPLFERVRRAGASSATDEEGALCERLQSLSVAEARALLLGTLRSEAARILRASPDDMKADVPLTALGFDSLMAVDLRLGLETRLGISLPLAGVSASTRLSDLAEDALARLRPAGAADCDTRASAPSGAASDESSAILKGLVSRHAPALDTEAASQLLEELAPAPRRSAR